MLTTSAGAWTPAAPLHQRPKTGEDSHSCRSHRPVCGASSNHEHTTMIGGLSREDHPPLRGHSRTLAQASATRLLAGFACYRAGGEQLPVPLGDDADGAVDHLYGGVVVDCVCRIRQAGSPSFCLGHRVLRQSRVIQVREDREVDDAQRFVAAAGRPPADEVLADPGVSTMLPALNPTQTLSRSDGRRSARPDSRIQWHRYSASPPLTNRASVSRIHSTQRSEPTLGKCR